MLRKIIVAIFFFSVSLFSQTTLSKKEIKFCQKKSLEEAKFVMEDYLYREALQILLPCEPVMKGNAEWNFLVGKSYLAIGHFVEALKYLKKASELPFQGDLTAQDVRWYYGQALLKNNEPDKALKVFEDFKRELEKNKMGLKENPNDRELFARYLQVKKDLDKYMNYCYNAKKYIKNPLPVKIVNLGKNINSEYPDFGPVINADGSELLFTSRRKGNLGEIASDGFPYEDIYISRKDNATGEWLPAKNVGKPINTEYHDATISLSPDGKTLFIFKYKNNGDIYQSHLKEDGTWGSPKPLPKPINTKDYWEPSVCISADGKYLFFVSDRPAPGIPGRQRDIYMCKKLPKGKWSEPIRLPAPINTPFEEDAPFLHPDGKTLYFSSDRPQSMGGFDIYFTTWDSVHNTFTEPKNIGYPINTTDNDIYFVLAADGLHGYYASSKAGTIGEKDIFMIDFTPPQITSVKKETKSLEVPEVKMETKITSIELPDLPIPKSNVTLLKGIIFDAKTDKPLGAEIILIDLATQDTYMVTRSDPNTGRYLATMTPDKNYGIFVKKEGYLPYSKNINIPATQEEYVEIEHNVPLPPIEVGAKIALRNIFFDFDKATLRPESVTELNKWVEFLKDNPGLKIEIGGHTDIRGSDAYNLDLSRRRAKSVYEYLKQHGIGASRMTYKGYGETQLLTKETTEEAHQLNRRVEIKITQK